MFGDDALQSFVQRVYKGAYKDGQFDKQRVNAYAKVFSKAVMKGYADGGGNTKPDFDTPDYKMLASLQNNVFHFSAAKNRAEIVQMSGALRDAKGKLRSYKDFTNEAKKVTSDFQGRYMKVEYDNAVNSSYLAARWQEFEADDILVFRTAGDERVRASHKALDGTALPKGHKFWDTFYPPLAWNCRCTVDVSHSGRATAEGQIPYGEIDSVPPIFRSNFAKEGMAFPANHPYFKGELDTKELISPEVLKASREDARQKWDSRINAGEVLTINTNAKYIDKISLTRKTVRTMTAKPHSDILARNLAINDLENLFNRSKYVGWAEDEIINGRPKHIGVVAWQYYKVRINGADSFFCVQYTDKGLYKPYCVEDAQSFKKIPNIKKTKPPRVHSR